MKRELKLSDQEEEQLGPERKARHPHVQSQLLDADGELSRARAESQQPTATTSRRAERSLQSLEKVLPPAQEVFLHPTVPFQVR